jgi:DNA uptake protein ComE-like DNA-binding protein
MSSGSQQQGFAIALLLWMIAGMSLMVAAVIHFARADIAMAELRLDEVRAQALGRGAALLALRDVTAEAHMASVKSAESTEADETGGADGVFTRTYRFGESQTASVVLRPAASFVSINNAREEELSLLFMHVGGATQESASQLVSGVMAYREDYPGFRYVEEMLTVNGVARDVYDRVKRFIHPYRTGALALSSLPSDLRESLGGLFEEYGQSASRESAPPMRSVEGLVTFESIAERQRNPQGEADRRIQVADVTVARVDVVRVINRVWLSSELNDSILRSQLIHDTQALRGEE